MFKSAVTLLSLPILLSSVSIQSYVCQPPTVPIITSPTNGTKVTASTVVTIQGEATASATVKLTDNGQLFATISADQDNKFAAQTEFTTDAHQIGVAVTSPCGDNDGDDIRITAKAPQPPISTIDTPVIVPTESSPQAQPNVAAPARRTEQKKDKLKLDVFSPFDGETTSSPSIFVTGKTNIDATERVFINGKQVASTNRASAFFGLSAPLTIGANTVTVIANSGKQSARLTVSVTRNVPSSKSVVAKDAWYETVAGKVAVTVSLAAILFISFRLFIR